MCFQLQIWDTAGQERFRSITQNYYRSAHAILLVYDVCCQPSFDCLPEWLSRIEQYSNCKAFKILVGKELSYFITSLEQYVCKKTSVLLPLAGNKSDKEEEREVPTEIGQSFAEANGFEYFLETSALDATNVNTLFHEVATRLIDQMKPSDPRSSLIFCGTILTYQTRIAFECAAGAHLSVYGDSCVSACLCLSVYLSAQLLISAKKQRT